MHVTNYNSIGSDPNTASAANTLTPLTPYQFIKRILTDNNLAESFKNDPIASIRKEGITDNESIEELIAIINLISIGVSQQNVMAKKLDATTNETLTVASEMKNGLKHTIDQIERAYRSTMFMYKITFYLGVLLILVAIGVALLGKEPLLPAIFGTIGIADLLAFFLLKPQEHLQASRSSLAQVQAALYNWFLDSVNLNSIMYGYVQKGDFVNAVALSESLMQHTDKTLEMLQKYCKLSGS